MATVQNFSNMSNSVQNNSNTNTSENAAQLEVVDCDSDDSSTLDDSDSSNSKANEVVNPKELPNIKPVLNIPLNTGPSQNLDKVAVSKSRFVHFGTKTYFNGPVTIKQFIESKAVENKAYVQTEQENGVSYSKGIHNTLPELVHTDQHIVSQKKVVLRIWHKVLLLMLCVVLIGAILTVVIVDFHPNIEEDTAEETSPHFSTVYNISNDEILMVVVDWYSDWCVNNTFVFILCIVIVLLPLLSLIFLEDRQEIIQTATPVVTQTSSPSSYREVRRVPLIIAPNHLRIVPRAEWLAQPPEFPLDRIKHPVPWVIIAHTAAEPCESQSECILRVRLIQNYHVESRGWFDIGYNFLVGGDGSAYYGRGWDFVGAHTKGYNNISMGIAFIGTFTREAPPQQQVDACKKLIALGVKEGKIAKDYKLLAHRQLMSTRSPGDKIYEILKTWPHFVHEGTDVQDIMPKQI